MTDYTQADLDQNKAINELNAKVARIQDQLEVVLGMLDKLAPLIEGMNVVKAIADRIESVIKRMEYR